jgi:DNA-binding PadR family transcriptional regulator
MSKWLQSGMRRDICALLYGRELRRQELKSAVESHYGERIEPDRFYGALEKLVGAGFVDKRTEGLHDVYALTDAGERAVTSHVEWLRGQVD